MTGNQIKIGVAFGLVVIALSAGHSVQAQQRVDAGKLEYEAHGATCHGTGGTGNGELRRFLTVAPSDLTTLARRNGGAFPNQLV